MREVRTMSSSKTLKRLVEHVDRHQTEKTLLQKTKEVIKRVGG